MIEALLVGMLAAVTVLFTFQTRIPYPEWMLQSFEHPWIFLCVLIAASLFAGSSPRISVMIILLVIAMWIDWVMFSKEHGPIKAKRDTKTVNPEVTPGRKLVAEVFPYDPPSSMRHQDPPTVSAAQKAVPIIELQYPSFENVDYVYGPAKF